MDGDARDRDAAELFDRHGGELFALALVVSGDSDTAERAVRVAFCGYYSSPAPGRAESGTTCDDLARRTYLACTHNAGTSDDAMGRALLSLTARGGRTYREAASIVGLPPERAAAVLRQALLDR